MKRITIKSTRFLLYFRDAGSTIWLGSFIEAIITQLHDSRQRSVINLCLFSSYWTPSSLLFGEANSPKVALTGNWTQASRAAGENSTTEPSMLDKCHHPGQIGWQVKDLLFSLGFYGDVIIRIIIWIIECGSAFRPATNVFAKFHCNLFLMLQQATRRIRHQSGCQSYSSAISILWMLF